jgi:hypothetical protein
MKRLPPVRPTSPASPHCRADVGSSLPAERINELLPDGSVIRFAAAVVRARADQRWHVGRRRRAVR